MRLVIGVVLLIVALGASWSAFLYIAPLVTEVKNFDVTLEQNGQVRLVTRDGAELARDSAVSFREARQRFPVRPARPELSLAAFAVAAACAAVLGRFLPRWKLWLGALFMVAAAGALSMASRFESIISSRYPDGGGPSMTFVRAEWIDQGRAVLYFARMPAAGRPLFRQPPRVGSPVRLTGRWYLEPSWERMRITAPIRNPDSRIRCVPLRFCLRYVPFYGPDDGGMVFG